MSVLFFWVHGEWIAERNKQIAWEPFRGSHDLFPRYDSFPMNPEKKTHSLNVSEYISYIFITNEKMSTGNWLTHKNNAFVGSGMGDNGGFSANQSKPWRRQWLGRQGAMRHSPINLENGPSKSVMNVKKWPIEHLKII